ncbi:bcl-2-related ovarian killer protein-like [Orussus abietinus]|uniref:bcl-2-related ovarian killer protein-like n=1 Tax=Orussus abietinus TaxID=222816 RepID=UPI000626E597|nr:bcl-2-related ovarian killer protein-like [Orussus abietinus]
MANQGVIRNQNDGLLQPTQPYRRNSFAAAFHANFAGLGSTMSSEGSAFQVVGSARRRFSNVGIVVSRKLSHTIGWRSASVSTELIVSQGSLLCGQYIRNRLKRSGIFNRKLGLKRMRSAKVLPGGGIVAEVYPVLTRIGVELEKMHPTLFVRVGRQIGCRAFTTEQSACEALTDVSREMLRNGEMTWSKIIALYAVAGGIADDCVRQGKPEFLPAIQRGMTEVLEDDLATWIHANGGWGALITRYRPTPTKAPTRQTFHVVLLLVATTIFVGAMSVVVRLLITWRLLS